MPRFEELRVSAGDATLVGTLTLPDQPPPPNRRERYPNVLLLPSWLPRGRDGAYDQAGHPTWFDTDPLPAGPLGRLADALAVRGVASLRCDPRGCGASEGRWEATDLFTKIDDARDQLAAMRAHRAVDLRRSGIIGHGEGATLALSVAIGDPAISALTLIGTAARSWRDTLRRAAAARGRTGTERRHPILAALDRWAEDLIERAERRERTFELRLPGGEGLTISLDGVEQAIHTPPLALGSMFNRSVTLVHGSLDQWSDPDESALLANVIRSEDGPPRVRLLAGAGHDLSEASEAVIGELADDLVARIQPRDLPPVLVAIEEMG